MGCLSIIYYIIFGLSKRRSWLFTPYKFHWSFIFFNIDADIFKQNYFLTIVSYDLVPSFAKNKCLLLVAVKVLTRVGKSTDIKGNVDCYWLNIKIELAVSLLHFSSFC